MLNGVDKEKLSSRCTKTFKGHFLQSVVKSLSNIKAELLCHCYLTVVYDNFLALSLLLSYVKKHNFKCCYIRPNRAGQFVYTIFPVTLPWLTSSR
jgi:hypothetical protein